MPGFSLRVGGIAIAVLVMIVTGAVYWRGAPWTTKAASRKAAPSVQPEGPLKGATASDTDPRSLTPVLHPSESPSAAPALDPTAAPPPPALPSGKTPGPSADLPATDIAELVQALKVEPGSTPLLTVVKTGNLLLVKRLLIAGVDVNQPGKHGERPVMAAVTLPTTTVLRYLLENGADPNLQNDFGYNALLHLVGLNRTPDLDRVKLLRQFNASLNAPSRKGATVLNQVLEPPENYGLVSFLLAEGADPNAAPRGAETPLMRAVRLHRADLVTLLLKAGADPHLKVYLKWNAPVTALDIARQTGDERMMQLLLHSN